jgi:hypothetical protein
MNTHSPSLQIQLSFPSSLMPECVSCVLWMQHMKSAEISREGQTQRKGFHEAQPHASFPLFLQNSYVLIHSIAT